MVKVVAAFLIGSDVQGLVVQMADMAHYLQRHCMLEVAAAFVLGSDMQGLLVQMADMACYSQKHWKLAEACSIGSDVQGWLVQITDIAHHFAKRPVLLRRIQVATCLNSGPVTDKDPVYLKAAVGFLAPIWHGTRLLGSTSLQQQSTKQ